MHIDDIIEQKAKTDNVYAVAYSLLRITRALYLLGNADASTPMGGLEALGKTVGDALDNVAASISDVANR